MITVDHIIFDLKQLIFSSNFRKIGIFKFREPFRKNIFTSFSPDPAARGSSNVKIAKYSTSFFLL